MNCDQILNRVGKEKPRGQPFYRLRGRPVVGIGSPGEMTRADSFFCGKSLGFKVAMKAACPPSAHAQNGLSPGSGDMSEAERMSITAASSLIRLTTVPIRFRRTPNLLRTSLYSARISALTSQVNLPFSSQSRRNLALGFWADLPDLNPAIPATRIEVSITPLGGSLRTANRYLRQSLFFGAITANRLRDLGFCHTRQIACGSF